MNFLALNLTVALYTVLASSLLIVIFILAKNWKNKINRAFVYFCLAIIWWSFCQARAVASETPERLDLFFRLLYVGVWFIPMAWTHFVISFLDLKKREWIYKLGYFLAFFCVIATYSSYFIKGYEKKFFLSSWGIAGPFYYVGLSIFIIFVSYTFVELFNAYQKEKGARKNQILYLMLSVFLGFIGGPSNFLYSLNIYIPYYQPFGTFLVVLFPLGIAYAILKTQLLDIGGAIKKTFIYSAGIALIAGLMVGVSFLSSWLTDNIPFFKYWTIPLIAGFVTFVIGRIFWNKSQEADKLKYEFLTIAAHKLRTPLTEIKWGSEALKDEINSPEFNKEAGLKLISSIKSANVRLIELTEELLSVSKSEAEKSKYDLRPADLEMIAQDVVNDFNDQIKAKKIKLAFNYEKNLPQVKADKLRISSVIQILLENAIMYTKDEIKISIDSHKDSVVFHIEDNGIGIKKEDQSHIFSKFYRSHGAYLTETEGTGIGLFLAKSIVDKHNGKIGVKSEGEGKGSVFWFDLEAVK